MHHFALARCVLHCARDTGGTLNGTIQMNLGLKDRVAIVTGGNRGIGYAISAELLREGAHVVVASLDAKRNAEAVEKLNPLGRVLGVPTDLNDAAAVENLFKTTLAEFGRLDILVNNATNISQGSFFAMTEENWDRAFDNKLRGTVRCIRHAVPPMRERKWGRIVNISGGAAWTPQLGAIATGINNAAVQNLTMALANELGKDGILVNAIVPTAVRTERHDNNIREAMQKTGQSEAEVLKPRVAKIPLGRMGSPSEIAAVVAFLASERASFVTGSAWAVDGGVSARL
jgi:NAD(P)-dependent dehydrogenase (short-subunit alcohol dehydrogenase family)